MKLKLFLLALCLIIMGAVFAQNNSVTFDGTDDHVQVATSLGISNSFTVEGWFYPTSLTGPTDIDVFGRTIFSASRVSGSYPLWLTHLNGNLLLRTWTIASSDQTINAGISTNQWYHVAVTSTKGSTTKLYLNGNEIHSYTNSNATTWPSTFTIGAIRPTRPTSNLPFQGRIDEVRVWNSVLSQSDIRNNMYINIASPPASLVGYYKLNSSSGTIAYDSAGTAQNGTLASGAAYNSNGFIPGLYYQARATGNWNSPSTWEVSADGSSWSNAVFYPLIPTLVFLPSGYTVSLNANSACEDLTMNGGTLSMGSYNLSVEGVYTQNTGTISGGTPSTDGYDYAYLVIAEDGTSITGFSASTSIGSNMPAKINRQWAITGSFAGSKTATFYWDADDDDNFVWGAVVPSVYKGVTEYTQTAYDVSSDPRWVTVSLPSFDAKATYTIGAAGDETLPVELSSFTAILTADLFVKLHWVTQSESGVSGYYIYRSEANDLGAATLISPMIMATNSTDMQEYEYSDNELYEPGTYYYWLQVQDQDGGVYFHGPTTVYFDNSQNNGIPGIPVKTGFTSIYPNPFNPRTTIGYGITKAADVSFSIYNQRGQLVRTIIEPQKAIGYWKLEWDGTNLNGQICPTGIYYIRMQAGSESYLRKAILLK
ncbi:hypothetical protein MASR1M36_21070 [Candidatus Cloacimonadaceae bacterium]